MVYYYKVAASTLHQYISQMEKMDFRNVSGNIGRILFQDKNWVRDDVDFPEAVETVEMLAFHKQDWLIDDTRCTGHRWITDECLRRIMTGCQRKDTDMIGVMMTIINQSPYTEEII